MNVVVIGSLPPPDTARSRSLLAEVLRQRRDGATVQVVSPTPHSVAHSYLELGGAGSALEVGLLVRRADRVIVQLQPGFPFGADAGRTIRAVGLSGLATALRTTDAEIVLRLYSLHDLHGGAGGRAAGALWARAARIEVGSEATREGLAPAVGPLVAERIVVVPDAPDPRWALGVDGSVVGSAAFEGGGVLDGSLDAPADLRTVTGIVRGRSAAERANVLTGPRDEWGERPSVPRVSLWEWAPSPGAGVPEWATPQPAAAAGGSPMRRAARAALYAAERHDATRPFARSARLARRAVHRTS